ncbi:ceramide synthase 1-like [Diadema antillarum]|uniref:ceramide synthase 1-like n=1 Tax=Diadema antillarum TaxID=105358 RepID=UPI003A896359
MTATTMSWSWSEYFPYPDYVGLIRMVVTDLPEYYRTEPSEGTFNELRKYSYITMDEVKTAVILAVVWTLVRTLLTVLIFKPVGRVLQLTKTNQTKMPESAWRFFFYLTSWSFVAWALLYNHSVIVRDPPKSFIGWSADMEIPWDIRLAYLIQGSYYLHGLATVLVLDVWRSDSMVLCMHHVLTLVLITLSYACRYHYIGLMVVLYHDFNDIFLEFSKCNVYFKDRGGKKYMIHEYIANASFAVFTLSWILMRMYLFPMKVLYNVLPATAKVYYHDHLPFGIECNSMMWLLMCLDIYWFVYIAIFLYKIFTKQLEEMEDIREDNKDDEATEIKAKSVPNGPTHEAPEPVTNGVVKETAAMNGNGLKKRHPAECS